jgi:hypothetical protein
MEERKMIADTDHMNLRPELDKLLNQALIMIM